MTVITRETRETTVCVSLKRRSVSTDGIRDAVTEGRKAIDTTVPFLDHMLVTLARYSDLDIEIAARGDLSHHIIEDVAICVGQAVASLSQKVRRFGGHTVPMDDALVQLAIDLGGRVYYEGGLPSTLYEHWMRSFAEHARATLHIVVIRGRDRHHIVEGAFKALGFALREALVETSDVQSTKGAVEVECSPGE